MSAVAAVHCTARVSSTTYGCPSTCRMPPLPAAPPPLRAQLYTHHVLSQLASDAGEGPEASPKAARTLPSFWAAKAAMERQRQREARRAAQAAAAASGEEEGEGEEGDAGQAGGEGQRRARKRRRVSEEEEEEPGATSEGEMSEEEETLFNYRCVCAVAAGMPWRLPAVPPCSPLAVHANPACRPASSQGSPFSLTPSPPLPSPMQRAGPRCGGVG